MGRWVVLDRPREVQNLSREVLDSPGVARKCPRDVLNLSREVLDLSREVLNLPREVLDHPQAHPKPPARGSEGASPEPSVPGYGGGASGGGALGAAEWGADESRGGVRPVRRSLGGGGSMGRISPTGLGRSEQPRAFSTGLVASRGGLPLQGGWRRPGAITAAQPPGIERREKARVRGGKSSALRARDGAGTSPSTLEASPEARLSKPKMVYTAHRRGVRRLQQTRRRRPSAPGTARLRSGRLSAGGGR